MRIPGAMYRSRALLALICFSPLQLLSQALQPYGRCPAPSQQGVNICMPYAGAEAPSPFQVIGAGTSGRGQVDHMELWADGNKIMQTPGTPFDQPVTLPVGNHALTLIEVDDTGFYAKSAPLNVTVVPRDLPENQTCAPPDTPGVNICFPISGYCNVSPWIAVLAAGRGATGPVVRMEMWLIDQNSVGAKVANFTGDHFETHPIFFDANYTLEIWEIDSHGHSLKADVFQPGPC